MRGEPDGVWIGEMKEERNKVAGVLQHYHRRKTQIFLIYLHHKVPHHVLVTRYFCSGEASRQALRQVLISVCLIRRGTQVLS